MASDWNDVYNTELSPLHYEMVRFAEVVVPTQEETIYFQELVSIVDEQVVDLIGRRARVEPFGSFAMGLSAHFSDLDLVVLNILRVHSNGMNVEQKARAIKILYKLANNLAKSKTLPIRNMRMIAQTKVPVLKIGTQDGAQIDLSLYNRSGVEAATFMRKTLKDYPNSIPVILVLKCLLKEAGLNEVASGGLGGYALTNMVLEYCNELRREGRPDVDCGEILKGFLKRFGFDFDWVYQAVSSRHGRVLKKHVLEKETLEWIRNTESWLGRTNGKRILLVEDPLTGRNLTNNTYRFPEIQTKFRQAVKELNVGDVSRLWMLLDVDQALRRTYQHRPSTITTEELSFKNGVRKSDVSTAKVVSKKVEVMQKNRRLDTKNFVRTPRSAFLTTRIV